MVPDSLAAEGYVALAADVYSGRTGSNPQENVALVQETLAKPEVLVANLDAAAAYLRARPDVSGKIAAMGWCYGGGVALTYALGGEAHEATAIFYGRLLDDPEQPRHLNHEIYGTFAGLDQGPSPEEVGKFVEALREAGVPNDIHIYDGVNHAFWLFGGLCQTQHGCPGCLAAPEGLSESNHRQLISPQKLQEKRTTKAQRHKENFFCFQVFCLVSWCLCG